MKANRLFIATVVMAIGLLGPLRVNAHSEVSASFEISAVTEFYEPLAGYGTWVEVGSYGRCWRPARVAVDWRPYCYGHWVWTDCGWYWVSDEPWAWACYHYGRWAYDSYYGWVWVPDTEWGPAWVSWREGGGYVGWAPLPPGGFVSYARVSPSLFVFVEIGHFHRPVRPSTVIINNTTIINQTVNITKIQRVEKTISGVGRKRVVVNEGPRFDSIQKATYQKVRTAPIREVVERTSVPSAVKRKPHQRQDQTAPSLRESRKPFWQREPRPQQDAPKLAPRERPRPRLQRELPQQRPEQPELMREPLGRPVVPGRAIQPPPGEVRAPAEQPPGDKPAPGKSKKPAKGKKTQDEQQEPDKGKDKGKEE
jgi:hypothetical protein